MERRDLIKILAASAVAAPVFAADESAVLDRLADIILPSDDLGPGAHDAGVVKFLNLAASLNAQRRQAWSRGVAAVEAAAQARFGKAFLECSRAQQEQIVESMAKNEGQPTNELERFFTSLKPAVIDGYRYSEVGVKQFMRWEGNHMDVSAWKGACNHPEHLA